MLATNLTDWLHGPETQALVRYLGRRKTITIQSYLAGEPVDPVMQGRAAELHELIRLLSETASEKVREVLKEQK